MRVLDMWGSETEPRTISLITSTEKDLQGALRISCKWKHTRSSKENKATSQSKDRGGKSIESLLHPEN